MKRMVPFKEFSKPAKTSTFDCRKPRSLEGRQRNLQSSALSLLGIQLRYHQISTNESLEMFNMFQFSKIWTYSAEIDLGTSWMVPPEPWQGSDAWLAFNK